MSSIKEIAQQIPADANPRNVKDMAARTGNIYETLNIISNRARQIQSDLKKELQDKLDEFSVGTEQLEEVQENKEQIEISKFYERMPNPALLAAEEFLRDELHYRFKDEEDMEGKR